KVRELANYLDVVAGAIRVDARPQGLRGELRRRECDGEYTKCSFHGVQGMGAGSSHRSERRHRGRGVTNTDSQSHNRTPWDFHETATKAISNFPAERYVFMAQGTNPANALPGIRV